MNIDSKRIWFAGELCLGEGEGDKKERFLQAWEDCVKKDDLICIVGNIADKSKGPWFERISKMPGGKILVLGNNERKKIQWYYSFGFDMVVPFGNSLQVKHALGIILITPIPCFESILRVVEDTKLMGLANRYLKMYNNSSCVLNIHGYTHGRSVPNRRNFDVSLEAVNYQPVLLEQITELVFKS
jgi:calcineurin-like phosphoesterase family protein